MERIGVGVAGLGRIGALHAEIFKYRIQDASLVAVVDVVEGLARKYGEMYGVKWYTDYQRFLEDEEIDAVVIATPTFLHRDMAVEAAEAGKHIFCEKPLTVTTREAEEVVKFAEKAGVKLQVGYMRRFDHYYRRAKEDLERGKIGKPLVFVAIARDPGPPPGWAAEPEKSGGIFLDMLSHDFDLARWLLSSEVGRVYVLGGAYIYEEIRARGDLDVVTINFELSNGALGIIQGSRRSSFGYDLRTEILGTEGTIYVGENRDSMYSLGTEDGLTYSGVQWFWKRFYDAYLEEDKHFVQAIKEDREPLITGMDGLRAVQIAEACWKSVRGGRPVSLNV